MPPSSGYFSQLSSVFFLPVTAIEVYMGFLSQLDHFFFYFGFLSLFSVALR